MASQSYQHHPPVQHEHPLRLKCLVLGSAGAGKTSLLRRFVHGTFEFEGDPERTDSPRRNAAHPRGSERRGSSASSTLGADYYVTKVNNPAFGREGGSGSGKRSDEADAAQERSWDIATEPQVLVQLWDTVGKDSLRPRRRPAHYDAESNLYQFLSIRPAAAATRRSDASRYNHWGKSGSASDERKDGRGTAPKNKSRKRQDAAGKHDGTRRRNLQNTNYSEGTANEPLEGALFRNVAACCLVYDATSSLSFLHLVQWHAAWTRKLRGATAGERPRVPFIVVATKLDLLDGGRRQARAVSRAATAQRRSVMGFGGGGYTGQDLKYEYAAENATVALGEGGAYQLQTQCRPRSTAHAATAREDRKDRAAHRLTYSLQETLWFPDTGYLQALQRVEAPLAANRPMILLWCQRHGFPHVEASALDGRGVEEAMTTVIELGVEELGARARAQREREDDRAEASVEKQGKVVSPQKRYNTERIGQAEEGLPVSSGTRPPAHYVDANESSDQNESTSANGGLAAAATTDPSQYYFLYQPHQEETLDLFARYSPKDEQRCSPFKCWLSFFAKCRR